MHDDQQLLEQLRNRSPEAFQELFNLYSDKIYRLAVSILENEDDAEDVTQEVFIKFLEHIDSFEGRSKIGTWLYRVAHNASIDRIRKNKTDRMVDTDLLEEEPPLPKSFAHWNHPVSELYDQQELIEMLDSAMKSLPETLRGVFLLRDIEELSTQDTAAVLGITEGAVKVRLHRARLQMRERLSEILGKTEIRS